MGNNIMLEWALFYAGKGLPVFPLKPNGKTPLTEHGCKDATTDPIQVTKWWSNRPTANIGIATGAGDCPLVVLDVDNNPAKGKNGIEALGELLNQQGPLPKTWLCLTGGGGMHYYFICNDPGITIGSNVRPGLDFRGRGGYVVAPPSVHESGNRYKWEADSAPGDGAKPAEIPAWLHALLVKEKGNTPAPAAFGESVETITEGGRNQELFRLASSLRAKGLTVEEMLPAVQKVNETRCNPPLPGSEVKRICESVSRYPRGTPATHVDSVKPPDYSDAGNTTVFTQIYQADLIFVDSLGWLHWDGRQWVRDDHKAMLFAQDLSARMLAEAQKVNRDILAKRAAAEAKYMESDAAEDRETLERTKGEAKAAKAYLTHAQNLRSASRLRNMLDLSSHHLAVRADELDVNPFDLNTPAGIIDLKTGQLRPHDRAALCSQMTAASPSTDGADMWREFLDTISCGDTSVAKFLQMVAGMALVGAVYQEGIVMAYGGGRNGKSTFFNALGTVLGDYSGGIDISTLTTDRGNKGASLATLRGKRLVVTGELEEHQRLSVATLKKIASTDKLVIEEKYKSPEEVKQTHTLVLFTNFLPRVGSTDGGTWRRLTVVPFNATIPTGSGIQNYADVLARVAGGAILSWAVEGAVCFIGNGCKLDVPEIVIQATEEYREREDWLNNFISERCIKEPNARCSARELYSEYREWAQDCGDYVRRERDFSAALEQAGYRKIIPKNRKHWIGLRVDFAAKYGSGYEVTAV